MKKVIVCLLMTPIFSQPIHAHNLADVIEKVLPSITYVEVERHIERRIIDTTNNSINIIRERISPTVGTGFVIEGNKIVTNYHVISGSILQKEKIYIIFYNNNGVRYEATIIGYDEIADVALLEIEGTHPSLEFADETNSLRMGEDVFTISNYYSIRHSTSQGIISSNDRVDRRYPYIRLLQLQILEGSGSSGGPVLNKNGKVVALNHTILSMIPNNIYRTSHPMIMSMAAFTIRGDQLSKSIDRIKTEGIVVREDLGLYLKRYGMTSERYLYNPIEGSSGIFGILVEKIDTTFGEPSAFRKDDIIVSVDNHRFTSPVALLSWLDNNTEVGDEIKIQVYRNGAMLNITTNVKAARRI